MKIRVHTIVSPVLCILLSAVVPMSVLAAPVTRTPGAVPEDKPLFQTPAGVVPNLSGNIEYQGQADSQSGSDAQGNPTLPLVAPGNERTAEQAKKIAASAESPPRIGSIAITIVIIIIVLGVLLLMWSRRPKNV